ncbi:MAG: hypothetical protein OXE41_00525 [Gammaproteobacteria bacterium]|nr:hypothetical protein [Gammaproteobacteria bacterium]MCY4273877.1 hypothetical protein [Gammaproteobacteria bacterium]
MELENRTVDEEDITNFELGSFTIDALLCQSGYLTNARIAEDETRTVYHLEYPNLEIQ